MAEYNARADCIGTCVDACRRRLRLLAVVNTDSAKIALKDGLGPTACVRWEFLPGRAQHLMDQQRGFGQLRSREALLPRLGSMGYSAGCSFGGKIRLRLQRIATRSDCELAL